MSTVDTVIHPPCDVFSSYPILCHSTLQTRLKKLQNFRLERQTAWFGASAVQQNADVPVYWLVRQHAKIDISITEAILDRILRANDSLCKYDPSVLRRTMCQFWMTPLAGNRNIAGAYGRDIEDMPTHRPRHPI